MRNKKLFSFNEERDAEKIVLNGFENGKIDYSQMYLVAKYFRTNFNYGEIRLERELIEFCKKQDENFNPIIDAESIKKWIKSAMKYGLRKIDGIAISQPEITFLKTITIPKDRKLLFSALVISKALKKGNTKRNQKDFKHSDNYYIRYGNLSDIVKLSGLTKITEVGLMKIFHKYLEHLTTYSPEQELIKLNYANDETKGAIEISNMDKIMEYYELLLGKGSDTYSGVFCEVCGNEIVKASNKQKYCKNCAKTRRKEQVKKSVRKFRTNVIQ